MNCCNGNCRQGRDCPRSKRTTQHIVDRLLPWLLALCLLVIFVNDYLGGTP